MLQRVLGNLVVLAYLVFVLFVILGGMRSGRGSARSTRGFRYYGGIRPIPLALISAFSIAALAETTIIAQGLALVGAGLIGVLLGFSDPEGPAVAWVVGALSVVGGVCGSLQLIDADPARAAANVGIVFGLLVVFSVATWFRHLIWGRSRAGGRLALTPLAWFAAVEVLLFVTSPGGQGFLDTWDFGWVTGVSSLVLVVVILVALALMPSALLELFAAAVILAQYYLVVIGLAKGDALLQTDCAALAVALCFGVGAIRGR